MHGIGVVPENDAGGRALQRGVELQPIHGPTLHAPLMKSTTSPLPDGPYKSAKCFFFITLMLAALVWF
jgi:hypothetical protein